MMDQHPSFDDGRGRFPDRIQAPAPLGMRESVRRAARSAGTTSAAFIRGAIEQRLRQVASPIQSETSAC